LACRFARYPIRLRDIVAHLPGWSHKPIGTLGPFQDEVRALFGVKSDKTPVVLPACFLQNAKDHLTTPLAKTGNSLSAHFSMWVLDPYHYTGNPHFKDQVGTGWGFAMMATGFQGNIQRGAFQQAFVLYGPDGPYLRMRSSERTGKTLSDDLVIKGKYCPNGRIGSRVAQAFPGDLQTTGKVFFVYLHPVKIAFRK
jgi:hypothetical protein